jgi:O-antigen/teichoic acid export membrane protein
MSDEGGERHIAERFTRDLSLYSVASVVPALLGLVALVIFTREFPPESYGRYALTMSTTVVGSTLLFGWLRQAVLRYETEIERDVFIGNLMSLVLLLSSSGLVIGLVGHLLIGTELNDYRPFFLAAVVLVVVRGSFMILNALFRARLESGRFTVFSLLQSGTTLVLSLVLSLIVLESIVGWVWGTVGGMLLTVGVIVLLVKDLRIKPAFNRELWFRMFRFGVPLIFWLMGFTLLNFSDRFLLEYLRGAKAVGVYSSNYTITNRGLSLVLVPVTQTVYPLVMDTYCGNNMDEVVAIVTRFTRYYLLIAVPATIGVAIVSRPVSTLLLGREYHPGFVVVPLVGAGLFLWYLAMIGHKGLEVRERTVVMAVGVGLAVVANVLLNIPLIDLYGYVGAAVATLISFAIYPVFIYWVSRNRTPWKLPKRTIRRTLLAGGVMMLPGLALYLCGTGQTPVLTFFVAGVSAILYTVILYLVGEFQENEIAAVQSLLESVVKWQT